MRVVHVINTAEVGGGAVHLQQLTRGLSSHGFTSIVIAGRDGPAAPALREAGVPVEVLGPLGPAAALTIAGRLRALGPDLLHLHGSRAGLHGALAARATGTRPVLYTAHMFSFRRRLPWPLPWLAARAESVTCGIADAVICLTRDDLDAARSRGVPTARFTVVPNGIELARFPAAHDRRAELGFEPGQPVVGAIARLVPQKDPLGFVRIAERVAAAVPEARFLLVGDGPLRADVEAAGASLLRERRLVLAGMRADVPELLATMDVVVLASLWEGLPLALLEAMAAERAVVASELPGHAEVLTPGETGCLVARGDADGFAREVIGLIRDPARRAAMGRRARSEVERRYSVERMAADTARLYREALERTGSSRG